MHSAGTCKTSFRYELATSKTVSGVFISEAKLKAHTPPVVKKGFKLFCFTRKGKRGGWRGRSVINEYVQRREKWKRIG